MLSTTTLIALLASLSLPVSVSGKTISPLTYRTDARNHTCQLSLPETACRNTTAVEDTCCGAAAALTLYTQYWDTYTGAEEQGIVLPKNNWGVHGVWADYCDGTYPGYCDLSRQYDPEPSPNYTQGYTYTPPQTVEPFTGGDIVTPTLEYFGKNDLLSWMNKYWVSRGGNNYVFWLHEFAKHATCFSTFDLKCYGPTYEQGQDLVDYFQTVAGFEIRHPTYEWLAKAGIKPSNTTTYTRAQIEDALMAGSGGVPFLGCRGADRTTLNEIWYFNHAVGRVQDLTYIPVDKIGNSSCNATAPIWYYERTAGSEA
ncbi:ribonuclease T2 [Filobasidium floriforme]|uniref:ribonuclease T2 n=1 Tax=Filobasidium floriforme TaxID=5210 RepID=UPI001E8D9A44|nr:ribonuclease T2 [Filobasidium floriforme]KAH8079371.1 ribonuclease T2 [Filobasidium floriforme]